jgi:hypothetical protein
MHLEFLSIGLYLEFLSIGLYFTTTATLDVYLVLAEQSHRV